MTCGFWNRSGWTAEPSWPVGLPVLLLTTYEVRGVRGNRRRASGVRGRVGQRPRQMSRAVDGAQAVREYCRDQASRQRLLVAMCSCRAPATGATSRRLACLREKPACILPGGLIIAVEQATDRAGVKNQVGFRLSWLGQLDDLPVFALHTDAALSRLVDARTCLASPPRSTTTCQWPAFGIARHTGLFIA
jgi:hypothetical protein